MEVNDIDRDIHIGERTREADSVRDQFHHVKDVERINHSMINMSGTFFSHSDLHWLFRKEFSPSNSTIRFSSLLAPLPGFKISALPHTEQGSALASPKHQPPGKTLLYLRASSSRSIQSRAGLLTSNPPAKAAPLSIKLLTSSNVSICFDFSKFV